MSKTTRRPAAGKRCGAGTDCALVTRDGKVGRGGTLNGEEEVELVEDAYDEKEEVEAFESLEELDENGTGKDL